MQFWARRPELWIGSLVVSSSLLVAALLWHQYLQASDSLSAREVGRHELAMAAVLARDETRVQIWFEAFVDFPEIHRLLLRAHNPVGRDISRMDLEGWLEPMQSQMLAAGFDPLELYLPNGERLSPVWRPDLHELDMPALRDTVSLATESLQPVAAVEGDPRATVYRHVRPVLDQDGRLVGSVGFAVPLARLQHDLESKIPGREFEFFLSNGAASVDGRNPLASPARLASTALSAGRAIDDAEPAPTLSETGQRVFELLAGDPAAQARLLDKGSGTLVVELEGAHHLIVFSRLTDALGRAAGLMLSQAPEPGLARLRDNFRMNAAMASGSLGLLGFVALALVRGQAAKLHERRQAGQKLQLAASVFTHAREGIIVLSADRVILEVNDAVCRISGFRRDEVLGKRPEMLLAREDQDELEDGFWVGLGERDYWAGELWARRRSGQRYPVMAVASAVRTADGDLSHSIVLFSDISRQKQHQEELYRIAYYDALTGLPNRALLTERVQRLMDKQSADDTLMALGIVDLDGFKSVNERHGQAAGDRVLSAMAERLRQSLPAKTIIGRLGGDEFCLMMVGLTHLEEVHEQVRKLLRAISRPLVIASHQLDLQISASIGLSLFPQCTGVDADQLLRQADQAMYRAKQAGKNRYEIFDIDSDIGQRERLHFIAEVAAALKTDDLRLFYQPKVNMRTGEVLGFEALIRWQHPTRGLLGPGAFLPMIEHHRVEIEVGRWVLRQALTQARAWQAEGLVTQIAVNIAADHLQHPDFVSDLEHLLDEFGDLTSGSLGLEVVETSALEDVKRVSEVITSCARLGILFDLDDFGTGYSSLTYLKQLPVKGLKIDQSFVRDMLDDPEDLAILEGVLGMARAFGHAVIAEGVETAEEGRLLLRLGCEQGQGYAIARPMPADAVAAWVATWQPHESWAATQAPLAERFALVHAMAEHRAWVNALEAWCRGHHPAPPEMDALACRFGKRLGPGSSAILAEPELLERVRKLHEEVHDIGREVVALREGLRFEQLPAALELLHNKRDELLVQMEKALDKPA